MDTTRLRRAFRYAADNDHSDEPEMLDEEEQDALIQTLAEQNKKRNEQFRQLLLAVPALATVPFLIACISGGGSSTAIVSMLGLTSLAATAHLVQQQPPTKTGIRALDTWSGADVKGKSPAAGPLFDMASLPSLSPLLQHLPLLNLGLCVLLLLSLFLASGSGVPDSPRTATPYRLLGSLPAAVYGLVIVSKVTMAGVDPERELNRLRYEYKGA